ncbi:mitochondrial escape protein 2 [Favolaschia claudopus]|uniref:Mitochondrial escape protein 2 n=1 Tax=Favolaschia claudopus TaxID=2862362 RepID=A0AAW0DA81_9AGAR
MLQRLKRPLILRRISVSQLRRYSEETHKVKRYLFVDAFPGSWDIRNHVARFREKPILEALKLRLSNIKTHSFAVTELKPHHKDGGILVGFEFTPPPAGEDAALRAIDEELKLDAKEHGGLPSFLEETGCRFWFVKGKPWLEDLSRYPSPFLRVTFHGPDIGEERLYELFRPYGALRDIQEPLSTVVGTRRSANVVFFSARSAAIAHNTLHGLEEWAPGAASPTKLHVTYVHPLDGHKIRDWITRHPRIVFPIVIFILGSVSYTIFDSIRCFMVQVKIQDWLDYRQFRFYEWLRAKSAELNLFAPQPTSTEETWKERKQADTAVRAYISDWPSTIAFLHGPRGSGKKSLVDNILKTTNRKSLVIDCRALQNATTDTQFLTVLAKQTNYIPFFPFINSLHHLIDLASVGFIGQKANLGSTLPEQVHEMLTVVRRALKKVKTSHQRRVLRQARAEESHWIHAARAEKLRRGTWRDARLDFIAGNGIMSELGVGDECMDEEHFVTLPEPAGELHHSREELEVRKRQRGRAEIKAVESLPIVVLRNFDTRGSNRDEVFDKLTEWAASLVESQIAHVIVISDNRENIKRIAKALPSRPLNSITLYDADATSALAFVKRKLEDADINLEYTQQQVASVGRLGGRASDLESLIYKVRSGAAVEDAVEEIIIREVNEVSKKAFGDDAENARNLPWSREQAWALFKLLAGRSEVLYHDVLLEFPFKGDEAPLRSMEHAELISIGTHNGRPSTIRPGKPVFKAVFRRLANDPIFQATQDIAFNEKVIANAESTVKACEQELLSLKEIQRDFQHWWGRDPASSMRSRYLLSKMHAAAMKIENLERRNIELRRVLSKGGSDVL